MPQYNVNQNPNGSYVNKYLINVICSYGYKLVCADDKFSLPFKSYIAEDAAYNFISSITEESKYCIDVMKKHFNKELEMTKQDNEDFENSTKCWVYDADYIDIDIKADHCHVTGKYRGSAHRDCDINVKSNHKISVVFHSLNNYDSHLLMP